MLLSIVTVFKQPAAGYNETYASVLRAFGHSSKVEYIIKEWDAAIEWSEASPFVPEGKSLSIRHIKGQDKGVFDAMNQCIEAAKGAWVVFLNAGDWFAPEYGAACLEALESNREADFIYSDGVTVDARDRREFLRPAPDSLKLEDFLHRAPILHPCLIVRATCLRKHSFNLSFDLAADYDLMVKLVAHKKKGVHLPIICAFILSGGLSERGRIRGKGQAYRSLSTNAPGLKFKFKILFSGLKFLALHTAILCIRQIKPLRQYAKSRSGGYPEGTFSGSPD